VSSKKPEGGSAVVEDTVKDKADVEASFKEVVARAVAKMPKETTVEKPTMDVRARSSTSAQRASLIFFP
jgi:chitin synthase